MANREHVMTVRVGSAGYALVERLMYETGQSRATVLRALFAVAGQHEPTVKKLLMEQL